MQIGKQTELAEKLWLQSEKSIKRRSAFRQKFLDSLMYVDVPSGNGLERKMAFGAPERIYQTVFEKVVRGLFFHHYGKVLGQHVDVKVAPLQGIDDESFRLIETWRTCAIGDTAFVYKFVDAIEEPRSSTWVMQLYEAHWILGQTGTNLDDV